MGTIIKSLDRADNIFASLSIHGQTLVSFYRNQFSSVAEIVAAIKAAANGLQGLAQVSIRNQSQGWKIDLCILFKHHPKEKAMHSAIPPHEGRQYLIPWA